MNVKIMPGKARGKVQAPPSKSMAHRLLICAGLCEGESVIEGISLSEDIKATLDCLSAIGAEFEMKDGTCRIRGAKPNAMKSATLSCRESGSTIRFFTPIVLLSENPMKLTGAPSLLSRPMEVYASLCRERGLFFSQDCEGVSVQGALKAGAFTLPGNISSQFISGLLFALPLLEGDSIISILPPVESRSYIELTRSALSRFGVMTEWKDENTLFIPGGQCYMPQRMRVEGDYSNAAFLEAFNLLGGEVEVSGLDEKSLQGDRVFYEAFERLQSGTPTIDLSDCPDLAPVLFALAASLSGGVFTGTKRLRIKESDRACVMAQELAKFGSAVTVHEDDVIVRPLAFHAPSVPLKGHNDHRIVMSMALLASKTGGVIEGAEAVKKSFPDFFEKIASLGIEVEKYEA